MGAAGSYRVTVDTPMGVKTIVLTITESGGGGFTGTLQSDMNNTDMVDLKVDGSSFTFSALLNAPNVGNVQTNWNCTVSGDSLTGRISTSYMPLDVKGVRI